MEFNLKLDRIEEGGKWTWDDITMRTTTFITMNPRVSQVLFCITVLVETVVYETKDDYDNK